MREEILYTKVIAARRFDVILHGKGQKLELSEETALLELFGALRVWPPTQGCIDWAFENQTDVSIEVMLRRKAAES